MERYKSKKGLFIMVSFMTGSRRKEISVRKITGAVVNDEVRLYLREFLTWVLIANIIVLPVVTLGPEKWLDEFPYVTHTGLIFYLVTLVGTVFIAAITVLWHTMKAGYANPADIMKYE
ncbi:MAG TPA: hypothetical protein VE870_17390 [Bacteroidales bacterium]|nr:hypothetical protein [Bacteroidales bacterium]